MPVVDRTHLSKCANIVLDNVRNCHQNIQIIGIEASSLAILGYIASCSDDVHDRVQFRLLRKQPKLDKGQSYLDGVLSCETTFVVFDTVAHLNAIVRVANLLRELKVSINSIFVMSSEIDHNIILDEATRLGASCFFLENAHPQTEIDAQLMPITDSVSSLLWRRKFKGIFDSDLSGKCHPIRFEEYIFYASDAGRIVCLNAGDGKTIWGSQVSGDFNRMIRSSPLVVGRSLFVFTVSGDIYKFRCDNGEEVQRLSLCDKIVNQPSYCSFTDVILIPCQYSRSKQKSSVVACDPATLRVMWENFNDESLDHGGVVISRSGIVIVSTAGHLTGMDIYTGTILWRSEVGPVSAQLFVLEKRECVVVLEFRRTVTVVNINDGSRVTSFDISAACFGNPVVVDDDMYLVCGNGTIHKINLSSWAVNETYPTGVKSVGHLVYNERSNSLIFGNNAGLLSEHGCDDLRIKRTLKYIDSICTKPLIDDARHSITIATRENQLVSALFV